MKLILENWRRFLVEQEELTKINKGDLPAEIYHGPVKPEAIGAALQNGITSEDGEDENHPDSGLGIAFLRTLEGTEGGIFLVLDGEKMRTSEQFEAVTYENHVHDNDDNEVMIRMTDSGSASGSGIDSKVSSLGTTVGQLYIKGLSVNDEEQAQSFKKKYPGLKMFIFDKDSQRLSDARTEEDL